MSSTKNKRRDRIAELVLQEILAVDDAILTSDEFILDVATTAYKVADAMIKVADLSKPKPKPKPKLPATPEADIGCLPTQCQTGPCKVVAAEHESAEHEDNVPAQTAVCDDTGIGGHAFGNNEEDSRSEDEIFLCDNVEYRKALADNKYKLAVPNNFIVTSNYLWITDWANHPTKTYKFKSDQVEAAIKSIPPFVELSWEKGYNPSIADVIQKFIRELAQAPTTPLSSTGKTVSSQGIKLTGTTQFEKAAATFFCKYVASPQAPPFTIDLSNYKFSSELLPKPQPKPLSKSLSKVDEAGEDPHGPEDHGESVEPEEAQKPRDVDSVMPSVGTKGRWKVMSENVKQSGDSGSVTSHCYVALSDDTELITPEWVYANFGVMGPQYSARQRMDAKAIKWQNRFERFVLFDQPLPQIKTRGQIRMLMFVIAGVSDLTKPANRCPVCEQRFPVERDDY